MAQYNHVGNQNDQYQGFESLPAGEYKVQISDTDIVTPKSGNGKMIKIVYEVVADAQYDGRKIFDNIIVEHSSADAERIGEQKLNTIMALTKVKEMKDTAQLHGKTLTLLLGVKEYNGEKQSFVKKYLPFNFDDNEAEAEEEAPSKKPSFIKR
jgi:hypothetical protein